MLKKVQEENSYEASGSNLSTIAKGVLASGRIQSRGNIIIKGNFKGKVRAAGRIIIGESGSVEGDLLAKSILVSGRVNGNTTASEQITISSTGLIIGDIITNSITIELGGIFSGTCKEWDSDNQ